MPEYVVERLDTGEQLASFDASDLNDAIDKLVRRLKLCPDEVYAEQRVSSAVVIYPLPFGESIYYEVGETSRSD